MKACLRYTYGTLSAISSDSRPLIKQKLFIYLWIQVNYWDIGYRHITILKCLNSSGNNYWFILNCRGGRILGVGYIYIFPLVISCTHLYETIPFLLQEHEGLQGHIMILLGNFYGYWGFIVTLMFSCRNYLPKEFLPWSLNMFITPPTKSTMQGRGEPPFAKIWI